MHEHTDTAGRVSAEVDDAALPRRGAATTGEVNNIADELAHADRYAGQSLDDPLDGGLSPSLLADDPWHIALRGRVNEVLAEAIGVLTSPRKIVYALNLVGSLPSSRTRSLQPLEIFPLTQGEILELVLRRVLRVGANWSRLGQAAGLGSCCPRTATEANPSWSAAMRGAEKSIVATVVTKAQDKLVGQDESSSKSQRVAGAWFR